MYYRPIDKSTLRESNLSSILHCLKFEGPLSRAKLAGLMALNKASISSMVEELIERKLVFEVGISITGTGRPATLLEINPRAGDAIGIEIGDDFILVVRSDFSGQIVWRKQVKINVEDTAENNLALSLALVNEALAVHRPPNTAVFGMGVTLPGIVDIKQGIFVFSPSLRWENMPVKTFYEDAVNLPVFVDNNSNAAALGEHFFGAAQTARNFLFITVGNGVGGGLFINGDIYRGAHGFAGEIGHINFKLEGGKLCRCGNRGCWETECNEYSIIERMKARIEVDRQSLVYRICQEKNVTLNLQTILEAAGQNDQAAIDVLAETGVIIGIGIASLINIFDPEMVVIGGNVSAASKYLIDGIKDSLEKRTIPEMRKDINVVLSEYGRDASVIGAIAMVVKDVFNQPVRVQKSKNKNSY